MGTSPPPAPRRGTILAGNLAIAWGVLFALSGVALAVATSLGAQPTTRPLPPIDSLAGLVTVGVADFATIPALDSIAPRMMLLLDERGTRRLFVNDMRGPIYRVSYDGKTQQGRWHDSRDHQRQIRCTREVVAPH